MSAALLRAEAMSVRRGRRMVLAPCDVTVHPGEVLGVYGPNGAGKSTLLQALAGLLPLASGRVVFYGQRLGQEVPLLAYHHRIAAVFQEALLLRGTVWHNVALGLSLRGIKPVDHHQRVQPWLERLNIAHVAHRPVGTLSGGEAQRTSLARALVLEPEILFLDEPFAALDAPTRVRLVEELGAILTERRIAALFVTHDLAEASDLCHRCVVLDQGHVLQEGDLPTILHRPCARRVAEITGTEHIFEATVAAVQPHGVWLDWDGQRLWASRASVAVGMTVTFVLQPEELHLCPAAEGHPSCGLRGRVEQIRQRGPGWRVSVRGNNAHTVSIACARAPDLTPGQEVTMTCPPHAIWIVPV